MFGVDWILDHEFSNELPEETIGIKGVPSGNLSAGVGFIIIPKGVDPELYVEDVMVSGRVSIYGGLGHSQFHNVLVDREVLQRLKFPKKVGEYGTPVVWVNIPKHNSPIIVACLKYDDDFHPLKENQKRITKETTEGNLVDIDLDPSQSRLTITVNSNSNELPASVIFKVNGKDKNGQYIVDVAGEVLLRGSERIVMIGDKTVELAVSSTENVNKARMVFNQAEDKEGEDPIDRLLYEDDKGNKIQLNSKKIQIQATKSKKITFGEDGDKTEPLVKGNTVVDKLGSIIDAINQITVPTAFGPSGVPNNSAVFTQIKQGLKDILSDLTSTD